MILLTIQGMEENKDFVKTFCKRRRSVVQSALLCQELYKIDGKFTYGLLGAGDGTLPIYLLYHGIPHKVSIMVITALSDSDFGLRSARRSWTS